jgi:hypothetical protein
VDFLFFFLAVLGFKLRASSLLGNITWATSHLFFALVIFQIGSVLLPKLVSDLILPTYLKL